MSESLGNWPTRRPAEPAGFELRPGLQLADFELAEPIGQGGMGMVWKARDNTGQRDVALKFLPPELAHDESEIGRVRDSFAHVQALHHQHICPIYSLSRDDQVGFFLVMKFLDGVTLNQHVRRISNNTHRISVPQVIELLKPVAEALDYAHQNRVVHRDIKPQNIMVLADGRDVQVVDFGLADQIRSCMTRVTRGSSDMSGTYPYMAPEQWRAKKCDGLADQYALAVVAYELVSGELPYQGDATILRMCVLDPAERPDAIETEPPEVTDVLHRGLATEKQQRFATCVELMDALHQAVNPRRRTNAQPDQRDQRPPDSAQHTDSSSGTSHSQRPVNRGTANVPRSKPTVDPDKPTVHPQRTRTEARTKTPAKPVSSDLNRKTSSGGSSTSHSRRQQTVWPFLLIFLAVLGFWAYDMIYLPYTIRVVEDWELWSRETDGSLVSRSSIRVSADSSRLLALQHWHDPKATSQSQAPAMLQIWNVSNRAKIWELTSLSTAPDQATRQPTTLFVVAAGFSGSRQVWAAVSDGTIRLWDETGTELATHPIPASITNPKFPRAPTLGPSVDESLRWRIEVPLSGKIACGSEPDGDSQTRTLIWSLEDGKPIARVGENTSACQFSADGERLLTIDRLFQESSGLLHSAVQVWEVDSGRKLLANDGLLTQTSLDISFEAAALSRDGKLVAAVRRNTKDGSVRVGLVSVDDGTVLWDHDLEKWSVHSLDIARDASRVIVGATQGICIWDVKSGELIEQSGPTSPNGATQLQFTRDNQSAVMLENRNQVQLLGLPWK